MFKLKITLKLLLINIVLTSTNALQAQNISDKKLNEYFAILEQKQLLMASIAIAKDNNIIYNYSLGYSNIDKQIKNKKNSTFYIGSISKTFTATLIMKAIEENKLTLNTTLATFFPQITNSKQITIQNLLNHSSGIFNLTDNEVDFLAFSRMPKTREEVINYIVKCGNSFQPNEKHEYSNSNYVLLSFILENVYNAPFVTILANKISKPLKLKNTYFSTKKDKNLALPYVNMNGWKLFPITHYSVPMGAGSIISSASDLCIFSQALFNGKIIDKKQVELMQNMSDNYGLGLFPMARKSFGHTGLIDAYNSVFMYFPAKNMSLALLINGPGYDMEEILQTLIKAIHEEDFDMPDFSQITLSLEEMNSYIGLYKSESLPLDITISIENEQLMAQATGQSSFPIMAHSTSTFSFKSAGIVLVFDLEKGTMVLQQAGAEYLYKKQ